MEQLPRGHRESQKAIHRKGAKNAKSEHCGHPANRRHQYFKAEDNSLCARAVPVAFRETLQVLKKSFPGAFAVNGF
jgi:hypothetical protein